MGHAEQFMKGVSKYATMKIGEQDGIGVPLWVNDTTVEELGGATFRLIPETLHRNFGKLLVSGDNITKELLSKTYESKDELCKGDTLIANAKAALKEAKKIGFPVGRYEFMV